MHPFYYNQKPHKKLGEVTAARDNLEMMALSQAMKDRKPILGICRGYQVINIALGGTLFQDLSCIAEKILDHADPRQTGKVFHRVRVVKNTRLYGIVNSAAINTNSSHHQGIDKLGKGLQASAFSSDGLIEAIEHSDFDFLIGVQWHPEATIKREHSRRLFKAFVDKALV
jgi:putative glutamine amidotransferase